MTSIGDETYYKISAIIGPHKVYTLDDTEILLRPHRVEEGTLTAGMYNIDAIKVYCGPHCTTYTATDDIIKQYKECSTNFKLIAIGDSYVNKHSVDRITGVHSRMVSCELCPYKAQLVNEVEYKKMADPYACLSFYNTAYVFDILIDGVQFHVLSRAFLTTKDARKLFDK